MIDVIKIALGCVWVIWAVYCVGVVLLRKPPKNELIGSAIVLTFIVCVVNGIVSMF